MSLEYTNRKGARYYVLQGQTKTGKPKYYCSRKPDGKRVDKLPAEFEIHEHPESAIVSVRKVKPSRLLPSELEVLKEQLHKLSRISNSIIDRSGDSFLIYSCDRNPGDVSGLSGLLASAMGCDLESNRQWLMRNATYSPAFRFTLIDENGRLFQAERWCYRSFVDGWIPISSRERTLDALARKFFPHLGRESFFELL